MNETMIGKTVLAAAEEYIEDLKAEIKVKDVKLYAQDL